MDTILKNYKEVLKLRGLAHRTIERYSSIISIFLKEYTDPVKVDLVQLTSFINKTGNGSTKKQTMAALNYMYINLYNSYIIKKLPKPKQSDFTPNILTVTEYRIVLSSIKNIKHRAIISLIYSCALRINEAIFLEIMHISKHEDTIKIVNGKGGKSAFIPIPPDVKEYLRLYYKKYRPKNYLFEGSIGNKYSKSSIRKVFNTALKKAKIFKRIRIHDLRHSRATHLLEAGVSVNHVQKLLRHKRITTTEKYLHLTTSTLASAIQKADDQLKVA